MYYRSAAGVFLFIFLVFVVGLGMLYPLVVEYGGRGSMLFMIWIGLMGCFVVAGLLATWLFFSGSGRNHH